jgi:hypothetical protein
MSRKIILPLAAALLAVAAVFLVRQHALSELQTANESLRWQIEVQNKSAGLEPVASVPAAESTNILSAAERNELLRLRNQVPFLRSEVNTVSNRVAEVNRPPPPQRPPAAGPRPASDAQSPMGLFLESQTYRRAQTLAGALHKYLQENGWQMPDDLAQLPAAAALPEGTIQGFELIRKGLVSDDPSGAPYLLLAREKEPRQLSDGRWIRLYIQGNGGLTIVGPLPNKPDDSEFLRALEASRLKAVQQTQSTAR